MSALGALIGLLRVPDVEAIQWALRIIEVLLDGGFVSQVEAAGGIDALEHIVYNNSGVGTTEQELSSWAAALSDRYFGDDYFGDDGAGDEADNAGVVAFGDVGRGFDRGMDQKPAWMSGT